MTTHSEGRQPQQNEEGLYATNRMPFEAADVLPTLGPIAQLTMWSILGIYQDEDQRDREISGTNWRPISAEEIVTDFLQQSRPYRLQRSVVEAEVIKQLPSLVGLGIIASVDNGYVPTRRLIESLKPFENSFGPNAHYPIPKTTTEEARARIHQHLSELYSRPSE